MPAYYSDMCRRKTCVYRYYDANGSLLYVGLSMNMLAREAKHRRTPWWPDVASSTEDWYPDRESAKSAERFAINHENPIHNRTIPSLLVGDSL